VKRRTLLAVLFAAVCVAACSAPPAKPVPPAPSPAPDTRFVVGCPGGDVVCETATRFESRAAGLSARSAVPPGSGMVFLYSEADVRGFWMKGCLVALDIAYLRDDGTVVDVGRMEAPASGTDDDALPRFRSSEPVRIVFEVAAGEAAKLGVVRGVKLRLPNDVAARLADADP
jgi:uncharacterized membrane protein (UPF0127 family)